MGRLKKYKTEKERKQAQRERAKRWYQSNKERILEQLKQYRQANPDKVAEYQKQYYEANKEHILEQMKQYYRANTDKIAEYQKQYYEANADKIKEYRETNAERKREYYKEYQRKRYEANKEFILEQHKQYNKTQMGRASYLLNDYRRMDRERGFGDVIDFDAKWIVDNIFTKPCIYCGETDWRKLGCDRIYNSKPHTKDNVVPCCLKCNAERQAMPFDEFLAKKRGQQLLPS